MKYSILNDNMSKFTNRCFNKTVASEPIDFEALDVRIKQSRFITSWMPETNIINLELQKYKGGSNWCGSYSIYEKGDSPVNWYVTAGQFVKLEFPKVGAEYQLAFSTDFIGFKNPGSELLSVDQWGTLHSNNSIENMFDGAINLKELPKVYSLNNGLANN